MENYLPEGEAKGHENNGKKMYSQGAELEPDQGNLPRGWGFGNICPGRFQNFYRLVTTSPAAMDCLFLLSLVY